MQPFTCVDRIRPRGPRYAAGVTLMELMVVMAIIGILSAIAMPTYQAYAVRSNRAAAKSCMSEMAQFMERYYTTTGNLSYEGAAPVVLGCQTESDLNLRYTIEVGDLAPRAYTVTATPTDDRDTDCGTLTVDQAATRTSSGTKDLAYCWSR